MPRSRSQSNDSDRPSPNGFSTLASPPAFVNPPPAYIAPSAASQIVTNDHETQQSSWLDDAIEPSGETAYVSPASLKLVNAFLDQLLYNFLSIARSTSLVSLRPAVTEVLKPKLAKEAISGADQELHEYLGGQDDNELFDSHPSHETAGSWDLERLWMRTRLRCMVYSSLGDMEEEDEDRYMEQESLGDLASQRHFTSSSGYVSPAVAIFLTSILEFIGEQALVIAGQAAYNRIQNKKQDQERPSTDGIAERVVVEERDTEKVAFNATLGRLWRTWRKRLRTPAGSFSRSHPYPYSTSSVASTSRRSSTTTIEAPTFSRGHSRNASLAEVPEEEIAASIPLPMSEDDVEEIEIPEFLELRHSERESKQGPSGSHARHKSLVNFPSAGKITGPTEDNTLITYDDTFSLPATGRRRANSLPTPGILPLIFPSEELPHKDISVASVDVEMKCQKTQDYEACHVEPSQASNEPANGQDMKKPVATILTTVATISAAAVAGIAATMKGETPAASVHPDDVDQHEDDDEEPQVMEYTRVFVKDGTGSPAIVETRSRDTSSTRSLSLRRRATDESPRDLEGSTGDLAAIRVVRSSNSLNDARSEVTTQTKESDDEAEEEERTTEQVTKDKQKKPRFVLGTPPIPRNVRKQENNTFGGEDFRSSGLLTRLSGPDHGAPPLTPLREMVEAAPDTSDEASIAPGQDAPKSDPGAPTTAVVNGRSPKRAASTSSSNYSHSRQVSIASSKISDQIHIPSERAAVQRVYTPPQTPRDDTPTSSTPKGRRSESFGKSHRPIHTSGSSTSHKLKGLMGWDTDKQSGQRKSDDEGSVKAQSFEQLIRSDETIQYTLTPENVREIDDPPRPSTQRSTMSVTRLNGIRGNQSSDMGISSATHSKSRPYIPVSRPPTSSIVGRSMGALPRDARTESESLRDFAEFIRSTGPDQPPNSGHGGTPSRQAPTPSSTRDGGPISPSGLYPIVSKKAGSIASSKLSGRTRLQARDASVPVGNTSSDLIDFIRQGPPDHDSQNPRIPRTVAPFRNTMDSDRIYVLEPRTAEVVPTASNSSLYDSKAQSAQSTKSHTSYNSQSGLLSKNHSSNNRSQFDEPPKPQRKQRRVRDPYAIDSDDDEDDGDLMPTPKPRREEESLIEFLNNVPPPAASQVTSSVFSDIPKPGSKIVQKKSSAPTLMNRFGRVTPQTASSSTTSSPSATARSPTGAPQLTLSRVGRGDSPLMGGTSILGSARGSNPPSTSSSSRPTYASHMNLGRTEPQRMNSKGSGSYMPRLGRTETTRTTTSDLADFLKNSGPPVTTSTYAPPPPPKVESGLSMAKLFRKKKTAGYA